MNVFVSAVEVGSVRALLPVCKELVKEGHLVLIERIGHFMLEPLVQEPVGTLLDVPFDDEGVRKFLRDNNIEVVLFSVNVRNVRPLIIARIARSIGICTVHLLDYWNGYRSRMELDNNGLFQPTIYFVPDEYASEEAISEGISENIIRVVGQPALGQANIYNEGGNQIKNPFKEIEDKGLKVLLFVAEPVKKDQGSTLKENITYRGYIEEDSLRIFGSALERVSNEYYVVILPHPRQGAIELQEIWSLYSNNSCGEVLKDFRGSDLLPFVYGAVGMASTLLYEAWLYGLPVLSIQPGLRNDSLRMMEKKDGVVFIDQYEGAKGKIFEWFKSLSVNSNRGEVRPELEMHKSSPVRIVKEIISLYE